MLTVVEFVYCDEVISSFCDLAQVAFRLVFYCNYIFFRLIIHTCVTYFYRGLNSDAFNFMLRGEYKPNCVFYGLRNLHDQIDLWFTYTSTFDLIFNVLPLVTFTCSTDSLGILL